MCAVTQSVSLYRSLLESSLAQTHRIMAHLEEAFIPLIPHPRITNETAPCCNNCLDEVFNILFVLNHKGEYLVYCHKCAMAMKKSFTVLRQVRNVLNLCVHVGCIYLLLHFPLYMYIICHNNTLNFVSPPFSLAPKSFSVFWTTSNSTPNHSTALQLKLLPTELLSF